MSKKPAYEELEQGVKELEDEAFERKKAEEALREREEKYRTILESIEEIYFEVDIAGNFTFFNDSLSKSLGYSNDELMGMNNRDYMPPESSKRIYDLFNQIYNTGNSLKKGTYEIIRKDGSHGFHEMSGSLMKDQAGQPIGFRGIAYDITERTKSEEALKESEERYRVITENMSDTLLLMDTNFKITYISPSLIRKRGYTLEELQALPREKHFSPASMQILAQVVEKECTSERIARKDVNIEFTLELETSRKDGAFFLNEITMTLIRDRKGNPTGFVGVGRDITDRKLAEEALRESEEKYRTILESIEDGYFEVDIAGNFTFFNDSMREILGYSKDELMGMNNRQYTDEENAKKLYQTFNTVYTTGKSDKGFDWKIIRKDGSKKYIEASVSLRKDSEDHPIGFRGIARDVSERRQAEEERARLEFQLQQAQKMEAIATLAGGVAHEFNNALMGILGNIELLKMDLPEDERRDRYFKAMKGSGHRMSRLTDQLLAYAQGGKYQPKNLKLDDFVIQTVPILQHDLSPTVRVETHFPKDISYIKADYAQMQMVLSAILANSNEAIEDEGLIRITAENKDVDADFTKQHPGLKPGPYVCLTIEDDGKGMDEETRRGIFEPFFTTKFQGRGMGMAAVYGIVKNHDGWIYVDSGLGKRTVVQIYFPAIEIELKKPKKTEVKIATGTGTILMIEDEDVVIEVTQAMLERLGYRVMVAKTGKDAIHITETFDGQIDLALLDIKLPDMEGGKVYPLIMEARLDLKVIVFSGYSIDGPARKILDAGAQDFIQKPFSLATLSQKLKEVLEGK